LDTGAEKVINLTSFSLKNQVIESPMQTLTSNDSVAVSSEC